MKRTAIPSLLGVYLVLLCASLSAQTDRGTIKGTVTDPTGAVIAGASVSATNSATGITTKTLASGDGGFSIFLLPTGTYRLTAEQRGFKKYWREGIFVEGGQTTHVDVSMELGELTQTLEVHAYASQIRPDTSDLGTMISTQQLTDLPMLGQAEQRNPAFFMILVPGVTGRGRAFGGSAAFDLRMLSTTVNGSQSGSTEFHLDGSIIASPGEFSADYRNWGFPVDAVGDFKLNTHTAPAEFGRSGGGIATFTLKSGTNRWHGSVYEYLRNDALDARGFFASQVPFNRQNEFGATVGGPIRKDKTFVFGWYSGFRVRKAPLNFIVSVPTTEFKMGNLSAYLGPQLSACGPDPATPQPCFDALGRPVYEGAVYDPETTRTVAAGAQDPATGLFNTSGNNAVLRDTFGATAANGWSPDNLLPSSRIDAVTAKILPLLPNPTRPGLLNNYESRVINATDIDQWGTRVDHAFSDRNRINSSFLWSRMNVAGASVFSGPLSSAAPSNGPIRVFRLSQDLILQPNLVNHATLGFNRQRYVANPTADMLGWPEKIGLTGVKEGGQFPYLDISNIGTFGGAFFGGDAANSYDVNESLTWAKGRHSAKFGFEYLKMQSNSLNFGGEGGAFTFHYAGTALPGFNGMGPDQGMASFLLGRVNDGTVYVYTGRSYERSGYYAGYAQDDFRITPKLTLNYGLRYDLYLPTVDKHNHLSWMDPKAPNPAIGGFKGAVVFATPAKRTGVDVYRRSFSPRLGLAFRLNSETAVRASYGIFWAAGGYIRASRGLYNQGINAVNALNSPDQGITPAFVLEEGWPASLFKPPPINDSSYGLASDVNILEPEDARPPYLQNWSFNIQRQLPAQVLVDVAYVGNKGTHLQSRLMPTNQLAPQYLSFGDQLNAPISDPAVQSVPVIQQMPLDPASGNHSPFPGFEALWASFGGASMGQALRPFPQYGQASNNQLRRFYEGTGVSTYHALQVKVDKRFSQSLSFLVAYTWSKTLTDAESQFSEFSGFTANRYDRKAEKSYSINDYPHNLVLNYTYELPFGPGKKWAKVGGAAGKVIGGWKLAGISQYQSGPPSIIILDAGNMMWPYEGTNGFMARPNVVPGVPMKSAALISGDFDPNRDTMFNPAAFANPAPWTFGNGPRTYGNARRFAYLNEDLSIIKRTEVTERVVLEFRADFLNIFNRTVFGLGSGGDQYGAALEGFASAPGRISSQSNYPREIQFGLRLTY